ncbi:MAG: flagellar motor protein [Nitrosomonas sp.]|nr:flagellar motor protein [Nitrosomonas sp.]MBX3640174.1 flagellar motor protein [Nitrosomonas sp.]MCW5606636.1 flagellar motor protein [Nitrosomonas sp.]MCW5618545.1 flagellar motor protein [Nitrosomonas sp.]
MDISSVLGIVVAFVAIMGGQMLEGGHVGALMQFAAFVIVVGGTVGAVLLQSPVKILINGVKMSKWVFYPPASPYQILIKQLVNWSYLSRKEGFLILETHADQVIDPLTKKGLQLIADGSKPEKLREILEIEVETEVSFQRQSAKIWEAAGGYAPTIGILGAVLGLIHVMENLSDPSLLGSGIAIAFVATIYGVGLANLLFLPIASKLKSVINAQLVMREALVDGLVAIANGENPREIENRLMSYFADQV